MASSADVYTSAYFALQNACWGTPQTPLICIFPNAGCASRWDAFLPGDMLRVVKNLHEVRSGFCQRSILHLFRYSCVQKRNAPHLHTVRKFFLRLQCRHLTHIRGGFCIQNVGCGVFSVAVLRQLHHGVVLIPKVTEANPAPMFSISIHSSSSPLHCGVSDKMRFSSERACRSSADNLLDMKSPGLFWPRLDGCGAECNLFASADREGIP